MPRTKRITDTPESARKGIKTAKGQPVFYGEKKKRVNFTLTPTALEELEKFSQALNLSVSEFIERIGRGIVPVLVNDAGVQEPGNTESLEQQFAQSDSSGEHTLKSVSQKFEDYLRASKSKIKVHFAPDEDLRFAELIGRLVLELVEAKEHFAYEEYFAYIDNLMTALKNARQQTQTSQVTSEHNLLTTQQAWEVAKSRGYTKSRDAFRAWSRRSPEKCWECHRLTVLTDPHQGRVIGYQDAQANETLEK